MCLLLLAWPHVYAHTHSRDPVTMVSEFCPCAVKEHISFLEEHCRLLEEAVLRVWL